MPDSALASTVRIRALMPSLAPAERRVAERVLADPAGRQALNCIRCSACLNICPVYERTGGHAYQSVYPGPIGAILTPMLAGVKNAPSLPYASSLCGACYLAESGGRLVLGRTPTGGARAEVTLGPPA